MLSSIESILGLRRMPLPTTRATKEPLMTPEEFEALMPKMRRVTMGTIEVLRRIMVEGETRKTVADATGLTPQRIAGMIQQFRAAQNDIPPGWVEVKEWFPPELAARVRAMAAEAKAEVAKK